MMESAYVKQHTGRQLLLFVSLFLLFGGSLSSTEKNAFYLIFKKLKFIKYVSFVAFSERADCRVKLLHAQDQKGLKMCMILAMCSCKKLYFSK